MSNANKGLVGWMKRNPGMTTATVLFIVALIAVIGWIVNRGTKGATGPGVFAPWGETATKPVISFGDFIIILKPDAALSKTSGYKMFEYATGAVSPANIDLTVTWTNGAGFTKNKVTSLVFRRFIGTSEISEPIEVTDISKITDFGGGSVTFYGSDLTNDATGVGDNIIKVLYTIEGGTDEILLTSTSPIAITQEQLDTTVDLTTITSLIVPVTTGSNLIGEITENPVFTKYTIKNKDNSWIRDDMRMKVLNDGKIQFSDNSGTAISLWTGSPTSFFISDYMDYQFIHDGAVDSGNYWTYPGTGAALESKNSDAIFKTESELNKALFKIIQGDGSPGNSGDGSPGNSANALASGTYHIKAHNGKYCEDLNNTPLQCKADTKEQWGTFTVDKQDDGTYSMKGGNNGGYCGSMPEGFTCVAHAVNNYERFVIEPQATPGEYAIKVPTGPVDGRGYCQMNVDGDPTVYCNTSQTSVGPSGKFIFEVTVPTTIQDTSPTPFQNGGEWAGAYYKYNDRRTMELINGVATRIVPDTIVYQLVHFGANKGPEYDIGYNYVTKQWVDVGSGAPTSVTQSLDVVTTSHGTFTDPYYRA